MKRKRNGQEEKERKAQLQRQESQVFMEKTGALLAVLILVFGLLDIFGIFHDQMLPLFILILGIGMNILSFFRDRWKRYHLLEIIDLGIAIVITGAVIYLIFG